MEGITQAGFRIGKPGMYGAGVYFATDSSKSGQAIYTKGSNKLLLCKVFLGRAKTVHRADDKLTGERLHAERFDSVFAPRGTKGTGGVVNDEFVVFDERQAVVKYVIHYSTSAMGLPQSTKMSRLGGAASAAGQPFQKERLTPDRSVKLNDPLEYVYRVAEGHFHRMMLKRPSGFGQTTIKAITVVQNPKLEARFMKMHQSFKKKKKGKLLFFSNVGPTVLFVLQSFLLIRTDKGDKLFGLREKN